MMPDLTKPSAPLIEDPANMTTGKNDDYSFNPIEMARELFDDAFYRGAYADMRDADLDLYIHYTCFGWKEGRSPNAYFDTNYYLQQIEDDTAILDPLSHYVLHGWKN